MKTNFFKKYFILLLLLLPLMSCRGIRPAPNPLSDELTSKDSFILRISDVEKNVEACLPREAQAPLPKDNPNGSLKVSFGDDGKFKINQLNGNEVYKGDWKEVSDHEMDLTIEGIQIQLEVRIEGDQISITLDQDRNSNRYCPPSPSPTPSSPDLCGNGKLDGNEACDDGNKNSGDGCSSACLIEVAKPVCGNRAIEVGEECDDGNQENDDGCSANCKIEQDLASPNGSITINNNASETTSSQVMVQLTMKDDRGVLEYIVTEDWGIPVLAWTKLAPPQKDYAVEIPFTLSPGSNELKSVYFWIKDRSGKVVSYRGQIFMKDILKPTIKTFMINDSKTPPSTTLDTYCLEVELEDEGDLKYYQLREYSGGGPYKVLEQTLNPGRKGASFKGCGNNFFDKTPGNKLFRLSVVDWAGNMIDLDVNIEKK